MAIMVRPSRLFREGLKWFPLIFEAEFEFL